MWQLRQFLNPKEHFEGKEYIVEALNAIISVRQEFKPDHIANVLSGVQSAAVKSFRHHQLETFGSGSDKDTRFWQGVIRQMLIHNLIDKDIVNYGTVHLTEKGYEYLKKPYDIKLTKNMITRKIVTMLCWIVDQMFLTPSF